MMLLYSTDETGSLPNNFPTETLDLHLAWIGGSFRVNVCESGKKVIYFRQYFFQQMPQFSEVLAVLKTIVSTDVLFGGNYRKVKIGISGRMELMPKEFYRTEENTIAGKLLNGAIIGVIAPNNLEIEFYNAFFKNVEFELLPLKWLEQIFPQSDARKLFIEIDGNLLHIAHFSEPNTLKFYNTFEFKTFEDFAYFSNLAAESLELDRTKLELVLSGDVAQKSLIYNAAYAYFQTVSFLQNDAIAYSVQFSDYPKHQNIALFSL